MRITLLLIFSFLAGSTLAQDSLQQDLDSLVIEIDSIDMEVDSSSVSTEPIENKGPLLLRGMDWTPPAKAALFSTILPGAGQFYNKQYLKVPIYPSAIVLFGSTAIASRVRYQNSKESLLYKVGSADILSDPLPDLSRDEVRDRMNRNRVLSNWSVAGAGFSYGAGILDAYISGHIRKREAETEGLHLPIKAGYYSALFPGCGQIYNGKWWKVPLIYSGFVGIGIYGVYSYNNMKLYRDSYLARNRFGLPDEFSDGIGKEYNDEQLLLRKNYHKKNLERTILFGTAWYALNIIDAVVDAHLYNFEITDDLSLQPFPYSEIMPDKSVAAGVGLRISLH